MGVEGSPIWNVLTPNVMVAEVIAENEEAARRIALQAFKNYLEENVHLFKVHKKPNEPIRVGGD